VGSHNRAGSAVARSLQQFVHGCLVTVGILAQHPELPFGKNDTDIHRLPSIAVVSAVGQTPVNGPNTSPGACGPLRVVPDLQVAKARFCPFSDEN
jgi:hypothetical protein